MASICTWLCLTSVLLQCCILISLLDTPVPADVWQKKCCQEIEQYHWIGLWKWRLGNITVSLALCLFCTSVPLLLFSSPTTLIRSWLLLLSLIFLLLYFSHSLTHFVLRFLAFDAFWFIWINWQLSYLTIGNHFMVTTVIFHGYYHPFLSNI